MSCLDQMLWNALVVAAPILLATLLVGLIISIFQDATQIQEMTLSYVPKILVAALMMIALGPWMIGRMTEFARSLYMLIPSLAGLAGGTPNTVSPVLCSLVGSALQRGHPIGCPQPKVHPNR